MKDVRLNETNVLYGNGTYTNEDLCIMQEALAAKLFDLPDVQKQLEMLKNEKILSEHPYKISEGKDGFWRTYLPDEEKGRKLVKRKTEESVKKAVIAYYKGKTEQEEAEKKKANIVTFEDAYWKWRKVQDLMVPSCNTPPRYDSDYVRFFKDNEFSARDITTLKEDDLKLFFSQTIRQQKLCREAAKALFSYVKRTIKAALSRGEIEKNPMEFLEAKQFYPLCTPSKQSEKNKVINKTEMTELNHQFYKDHQSQPEYIPTYAVELASLTGMRVGELSGLRWEKVTEQYIIIDTSEKFNRVTKQYFIDKTKNKKVRRFPITDEIRELLDRVKEVERENGFLCEWVFADADGRVHAPVISSCAKNKSRQVGIRDISIQEHRRTVNSRMKHNGVSSATASAMMGHTEAVNDDYYTFDVSDMEEKRKIVSVINAQVRKCI